MDKLTGTVKTAAPLPEITPTADMPAIPVIKKQSLVTLLPSMKKENGSPLVTPNQAIALTELKFDSGDKILTLEDRPFVYEVANMLGKMDYDIVYNFLNAGWEKVFGSGAGIRKKIIFENPLLSKSKDKLAMDMEIYRNKIDVESGAFDCRKCQSKETLSVARQTRSADEATSVFVSCLSCGYKWRAQ